ISIHDPLESVTCLRLGHLTPEMNESKPPASRANDRAGGKLRVAMNDGLGVSGAFAILHLEGQFHLLIAWIDRHFRRDLCLIEPVRGQKLAHRISCTVEVVFFENAPSLQLR